MKKISFMDGWTFAKEGEELKEVILPHDAMIHEKRESDAPGGSAHAYFPGGHYVYEKRFMAYEDWDDKSIFLEFEGVYHNSEVFLNGEKIASRPYGYVPFTAELSDKLLIGKENVLKVAVDNSDMPNSRWYSGSGIYRPVNLYIGGKAHIAYQGIRITTVSYDPAIIQIGVITGNVDNASEVLVEYEIIDDSGNILTGQLSVNENGLASEQIEIKNANLWSEESPVLYRIDAKLVSTKKEILDTAEDTFGIRLISYSREGLFINGKSVLLRGGCVHHDNGILGAASFPKAEERRVRILKEQGFNAIRVSHNPASSAMLDACDRYGMYVMDETFDMWYVRKSKYDYALHFKEWWKKDTRAMVERDYNHPSVIMYSIGNEVSEPGKPEGVEQGKEIIAFMKSIDATRAITGGMNLMIMSQYASGKGQYDNVDENRKTEKEDEGHPKNASLAFNMMAMVIGTGMNNAGRKKKVDKVTSPMLDELDIVGYNYGSGRYPLDKTEHPDRIIVGSETFPQDINKNWKMVKEYPYLLGDFMWTAWDYLGEAGIGAWSYTGGMPFNRPYPWLLGGAGVIDITGVPDVSCKNARMVWDQIHTPVIGVRPVNHPGVRVSKSVWRGTNAIESWAWKDCDGNKAVVEVYAREPYVELFINGKSQGRKKTKMDVAVFKVKYVPGTIEALTYNAKGEETGRSSLMSASGELRIEAAPEETQIRQNDIVYIPVTIKGQNGVVESNGDALLSVTVENGIMLGFGSANPCTREAYDTGKFASYYGRALLVCYGEKKGSMKIKISAQGMSTAEAEVDVI